MSDKPISLSTSPEGYADWLAELKSRIHSAQQRATLAVNRELVLLYWQIGRDILVRQADQGWGAKVIDRLAHDLRNAFPKMKGFSPRNLKYMRAVAEAWPEPEFVQQVAAQLPWFHLCTLIDKLATREERDWYLAKAVEHNWSRNVLVMQIETRLRERPVKSEQDNPTIGLLLCKSKNQVVAEYALGDKSQPMGIAEYKLMESLPEPLQTSLPSIEQIENELKDIPA